MTWRAFENLVHRKLLSAGWRVQRAIPIVGGWQPAQAYWTPAYIERLGFRPATLIDVGVGHGTPELYRAFPDAFLLLIEPVAEFAPGIAGILGSRRGEHVPVALASQSGERNLRANAHELLQASFYERQKMEAGIGSPAIRKVPAETLDYLMAARDCPRPFGLKIDAEGAELEIIRGARSTLRDTEFVIAEVAVIQRFEGGYRFAELIAELDKAEFDAVDILDIGRSPTSEVIFFDLVFRKRQ